MDHVQLSAELKLVNTLIYFLVGNLSYALSRLWHFFMIEAEGNMQYLADY